MRLAATAFCNRGLSASERYSELETRPGTAKQTHFFHSTRYPQSSRAWTVPTSTVPQSQVLFNTDVLMDLFVHSSPATREHIDVGPG